MSDYLLLYQGGSMPETEAEQKQVMDAWTSWFTSAGLRGEGPRQPDQRTGQDRSPATEPSVDGPAVNVSGYTLLKAGSLDDAVALSKDCPVLDGGANITIHEIMEVM